MVEYIYPVKKFLATGLLFLLFLCGSGRVVGQVLDIRDFGAVSATGALQTTAIQAAIDSAERAGGGTVLIPQGVYLSSTLFLKDNVTLEIAKNATLKGATRVNQYPVVIPAIRSYADRYPQRSLIYAEGKRNITIRGEGTIDGNGLALDFLLNSDDKPFGIRFISCTNVLYEGVTLKNSGFWMMHNLNCDTLTIRNLTIINHNFGNGDGINIDGCRNVLVENCTVDSNNDPVVIKTTSPAAAEDIVVRHCTLSTYSRAIKVGTETYGPVRNIHIHDCVVKYSTAGPFGNFFPASCGILLSIVDGGLMENVVVENVSITGVQTPLLIRLGRRGQTYDPSVPPFPTGSLRNVSIRNVDIHAVSNITSSISGVPGHNLQNISLQNVTISVPGGLGAPLPGLIVPENVSSKPENDMFGEDFPSYGLFIRHVDTLMMENVCITARQPDGREELYFEDTSAVSYTPCYVTSLFDRGAHGVKVFPNPVKDRLFISLPEGMLAGAEWEVLDLLGRTWLKGNIAAALSGGVEVSPLPAGKYLIRVMASGHVVGWAGVIKY